MSRFCHEQMDILFISFEKHDRICCKLKHLVGYQSSVGSNLRPQTLFTNHSKRARRENTHRRIMSLNERKYLSFQICLILLARLILLSTPMWSFSEFLKWWVLLYVWQPLYQHFDRLIQTKWNCFPICRWTGLSRSCRTSCQTQPEWWRAAFPSLLGSPNIPPARALTLYGCTTPRHLNNVSSTKRRTTWPLEVTPESHTGCCTHVVLLLSCFQNLCRSFYSYWCTFLMCGYCEVFIHQCYKYETQHD